MLQNKLTTRPNAGPGTRWQHLNRQLQLHSERSPWRRHIPIIRRPACVRPSRQSPYDRLAPLPKPPRDSLWHGSYGILPAVVAGRVNCEVAQLWRPGAPLCCWNRCWCAPRLVNFAIGCFVQSLAGRPITDRTAQACSRSNSPPATA